MQHIYMTRCTTGIKYVFDSISKRYRSQYARGLPQTMRYVDIQHDTSTSKLIDATGPLPSIAPDEVLIKVHAAGVNRPDILQKLGQYPAPPGASTIPGLEVSGHIVGIGSAAAAQLAPYKALHDALREVRSGKQFNSGIGGSTMSPTRYGQMDELPDDLAMLMDHGYGGSPVGWQLGEPVCALVNGGGYAEYVAVPAGQVMPMPPLFSKLRHMQSLCGSSGLSPSANTQPPERQFVLSQNDLHIDDLYHFGPAATGIQAWAQTAALPESFFTVWHNMIYTGGLRPGDVFLVHGGASGIGTSAIQLARQIGAYTIVTAGTDEKCAACIRLGADIAINYKQVHFASVLNQEPFKQWLKRNNSGDISDLFPETQQISSDTGTASDIAIQVQDGVFVRHKYATPTQLRLATASQAARTWGTSTIQAADTAPLADILPSHTNSLLLNRLTLLNQRGLEASKTARHYAGADRMIQSDIPGSTYQVGPLTRRPLAWGDGINLVLDMVGGDYIGHHLKLLGTQGILVNIAFQKGAKIGQKSSSNHTSQPSIDLTRLMLKRLTMTGSTIRSRSNEAKAGIAVDLYGYVWPLLTGLTTGELFQPIESLSKVKLQEKYLVKPLHHPSEPHITQDIIGSDTGSTMGAILSTHNTDVMRKNMKLDGSMGIFPLTAEGAEAAHQALQSGTHFGKYTLVNV